MEVLSIVHEIWAHQIVYSSCPEIYVDSDENDMALMLILTERKILALK